MPKADSRKTRTTQYSCTFLLPRCLSRDDGGVVKTLPSRHLVRLTQSLVRVIEMAMDVAETASTLALDTVTPWILLYRLIHQ